MWLRPALERWAESCCSPVSQFSLDWLSVPTGCVVHSLEPIDRSVMEVSGRRSKTRNPVQPEGANKCLSSTYRSFRDSDVSLLSLSHKSITLLDIPEWSRRRTANSSNLNQPERSQSKSSSDLPTTDRDWSVSDEITAETSLSCCSPEPPGGWPLVHRCLRTLSHGHWFHHWRKFLKKTTDGQTDGWTAFFFFSIPYWMYSFGI